MLTKGILFGMNILTLAGFVVMGLTLTLNRMGQAGKALSIGLMAAGTAWSSRGCTQGIGRDRARFPARSGFTPPYETSYRGVKLPRVSAALGRLDLRRGADLPPVSRFRLPKASRR